jgi:hypothetical protein
MPEGLMETMKSSFRIDGVAVEIRTDHLQNKNPQRYHYTSLLGL